MCARLCIFKYVSVCIFMYVYKYLHLKTLSQKLAFRSPVGKNKI